MRTAMDLSKTYFEDIAFPALQEAFPKLAPRLAAGLVGNGSECFGYDDEISRDHDWGIDFFIWLPDQDQKAIPAVAAFKQRLFAENPPMFQRQRSEYGAHVGVTRVGDFYQSLIGYPEGPEAIDQWRRVPEENLAIAVNGKVFYDGDGEFTRIREKVLQHYPEDLRKKKMAARCMAIAQTGQYNYLRMARRKDWVTVQTVLSRFCDNVMGLVFLLKKIYRPFYKWAYRRMTGIVPLGLQIGGGVSRLTLVEGFSSDAIDKRYEEITTICSQLAAELQRQGLTRTTDWFFTSHAQALQQGIGDEFLRSLPPQYE